MSQHPTSLAGTTYFPGEHPKLAAILDNYLGKLGDDARERANELGLEALILAGGYGRGEGGVFIHPETGEEELYNDLEFFAFSKGAPSSQLTHWIHDVEASGTDELRIDVEIKAMSLSGLYRAEPSMFLYDLAEGHLVVQGAPNLLEHSEVRRVQQSRKLPIHEGTRLLFNRGTGLLFAAEMLFGETELDTSFVIRNHNKIKLALGDALLTASGRYHWSCRERASRLAERDLPLPDGADEVLSLHRDGVEFKLHPRHPQIDAQQLREEHLRLRKLWEKVFLWVESLRLKQTIVDLDAYAQQSGRLLPEIPLAKCLACRARDLIKHRERLPCLTDYPRGVLQRALAAFLSSKNGALELPTAAQILATEEEEAVSTYRRWWARYN